VHIKMPNARAALHVTGLPGFIIRGLLRYMGDKMKKVAVIMGSDSDLPTVEKAIETLDELQIPREVHVYSAHRTYEQVSEFTRGARDNGFGVIIAAAGKAAHLAGAVAAQTTLPVIGIPVSSKTLDGIDALLSTVQMPSGIPVATVAIDGAANAALLAAEILAVEDADLAQKLESARSEAAKKVLEKNESVQLRFNTRSSAQ
jgi:5-(carboxyamino)imidazole ribonucleotide mutase